MEAIHLRSAVGSTTERRRCTQRRPSERVAEVVYRVTTVLQPRTNAAGTAAW